MPQAIITLPLLLLLLILPLPSSAAPPAPDPSASDSAAAPDAPPPASDPPPPRRRPRRRRLADSVHRFDASLLGPDFAALIDAFDSWIGPAVDRDGAELAASRVGMPSESAFRDECGRPPDRGRYADLEARKKGLEHRMLPPEEELLIMHRDFFGSEGGASEGEGPPTTYRSGDRKWTWRPAAHFSSRGGDGRVEFRRSLQRLFVRAMGAGPGGAGDWDGGRVSGTYWYPPGAVREWHTNRHDVGTPRSPRSWGGEEQDWRMYYVRTRRPPQPGGGGGKSEDGSAMHVMEGPGAGPDALWRVGAYPLPTYGGGGGGEVAQTDGVVWRIPDQDGYVTLFRIPDLWHCVVSESVHRFSLGFALSEGEAQALLRRAGVPHTLEGEGGERWDDAAASEL